MVPTALTSVLSNHLKRKSTLLKNLILLHLVKLKNNLDVEAFTLEVPVNSDVNYADYLKSNTISYKITGTTRTPIKDQVHIKGKAKFDVEAGL